MVLKAQESVHLMVPLSQHSAVRAVHDIMFTDPSTQTYGRLSTRTYMRPTKMWASAAMFMLILNYK
jgi:hypothetical protein